MRKLGVLFAVMMLGVGLWAQETSQPDTVRIFNDILIIDEVYNPNTWELVGWSYNSHDNDGLYTFIRTNQLEKFGTFSFEKGTIDTVGIYNIVKFVTITDTVKTTFVEGQMTIVEKGDSIILDGEFKGDDGNVYLFHCTHLTEALNSDTDIDIEQEYKYYQMFSFVENGEATIEIENKEIMVLLQLNVDFDATEIPAGTYPLSANHEVNTAQLSVGVSNFAPQLCYAATIEPLTGQIRDYFFMTEGNITIRYDEYGKMNVEVNTKNSYKRDCHVTVTYHYVEPIDTITIDEDVDFEMARHPLDRRYYMCQIYEHQEGLAGLLIRTNNISGDFTREMRLPGSMIHTQDGYYRSLFEFVQCTVEKEGKDMTLETQFIANDSILYIIRGIGYEGAIIGEAKTDYEGQFIAIEDGISINHDTCTIGLSNQQGDNLNFAFIANIREDGTIVPSEYTKIVPGGERGIFGLLPSYVENDSNIWFIQSGTMTVNEDGSMSFEGVNSYDKSVKFTGTAKGTDLINVNDNSNFLIHNSKFIKNAQLFIRKNGKTYNAVGAEL